MIICTENNDPNLLNIKLYENTGKQEFWANISTHDSIDHYRRLFLHKKLHPQPTD